MIYFKSNILPIFAMMLAILMMSYGITGKAVLKYQIERHSEPKLILEQSEGYFEDIAVGVSHYLGCLVRVLKDLNKIGFGLNFSCLQALIRFEPSFALSIIFLLLPYQLLTQYYIEINAP